MWFVVLLHFQASPSAVYCLLPQVMLCCLTQHTRVMRPHVDFTAFAVTKTDAFGTIDIYTKYLDPSDYEHCCGQSSLHKLVWFLHASSAATVVAI